MTMTGMPREETAPKDRSWLVRVMWVIGLVLLVAVLFAVWAAMAQVGWGDEVPSATVSGQIELTRDQPVMAVEFEASFTSIDYLLGIDGKLEAIQPAGSELTQVAWVEATHWDGEQWLPGTQAEITQLGLNIFRFRWVLQLSDGVDRAIMPLEAQFFTVWSDGDGPLPGKAEVSDVHLKLVSIYPYG